MKIQRGDKYNHYKDKEYTFFTIALPLHDDLIEKQHLVFFKTTRYHDGGLPIDLYNSREGAVYIMSNVPHVIYQSSDDYGTEETWAREVDDFFDFVYTEDGAVRKRFF